MGLVLNPIGVIVNIAILAFLLLQTLKHYILYKKHGRVDSKWAALLTRIAAMMSMAVCPLLCVTALYSDPRTIIVLALWVVYITTLMLDVIISLAWLRKTVTTDVSVFTTPSQIVFVGFSLILIAKAVSCFAVVL